MNIKEIKELVKMLDGTDITEFTLETEGDRVVIKKGVGSQQVMPQMTPALPIATNPLILPGQALPTTPQSSTEEPKKEGLGPNQVFIIAPMVGTFYRAPGPDTEQYVQAGQTVEVGQVVCIIEAMKLMNEIESEWRGKIVEILVENAQPVEYGQPLFLLEKL
jgi:oxaloacetate decarboxylase alpha subunit